jgi:four helix bundle protein
MLPYERFDAWKACHALTLEVYRVTKKFPKDELYGLTSQARRAAFSSGANIAEGSAKRGPREFRRYLDISLGSLSELGHTLRIARDLAYLTNEEWQVVDTMRNTAGKRVWGLYKSLE